MYKLIARKTINLWINSRIIYVLMHMQAITIALLQAQTGYRMPWQAIDNWHVVHPLCSHIMSKRTQRTCHCCCAYLKVSWSIVNYGRELKAIKSMSDSKTKIKLCYRLKSCHLSVLWRWITICLMQLTNCCFMIWKCKHG